MKMIAAPTTEENHKLVRHLAAETGESITELVLRLIFAEAERVLGKPRVEEILANGSGRHRHFTGADSATGMKRAA